MPTVLTHPVAAAALGSVANASRAAVIAGAALSILPDTDVYLARALQLEAPHWIGHRGFTHSLAFAALVAIAVAAAFRTPRRGSRAWWSMALFLAACGASHGLLDAMTNGGAGVMLLWPFSQERYFLPWRPIPVSPLGRGFLSDYGWHVFLTELALIWMPCAAVIVTSFIVRRHRGRG